MALMSPNPLMAANYMQMQQRIVNMELAKQVGPFWPSAGGILPTLPVGLPTTTDSSNFLQAFLAANPVGTSTSAVAKSSSEEKANTENENSA